MIPQVVGDRAVWVARCGAPGCHATRTSLPDDTRTRAEQRLSKRGWRFTSTPLCPLHARQYAPRRRTP